MRAQELRRCTSESNWKDPSPVALTTSDGGGDSPAARAPSPAPPQLPLRKLASPPPRAHSRALTLASARQAGALGRGTEKLQRPRVPLTGPAWASRLRSPPPHALPGRALAERRRQLERRAPHLLGKVGGGEGAPLVQRVGQKPALGRRSNSPASRHFVSTVAAAADRQPRQEEGGDAACS